MFETLTKGFRAAKNRLAGVAELSEENIEAALRDVRLSLLEADVELGVVKRFLATVKEKSLGEVVQTHVKAGGKKLKVGPAEHFIRICQEELTAMMSAEGEPFELKARPQVTGVMMVGLQGSGKTTTAAKLARFFQKKDRKVLLVAADVQRPGAIEQLQTLGEQIDVPVFAIPGGQPVDICAKAMGEAKKLKCDTIIYDTAGRLAIDEPLMKELAEIKGRTKADNVYLVVDAMIGQDAVKTAATFHERLSLTGVVLTKLDGDARGGAALSIKQVTGAPVRFVGTGETIDRLEEFRPDGMASRILGMGDIVGLMKDFEEVVDEQKAEEDAKRMLEGRFTLHDFLEQIRTLQQMGPLQQLFEKLPFFADSVPEGFNVDEGELKRAEAIVSSMTKRERRDPEIFGKEPSRVTRVAKGCGRAPKDVVDLLQRFMFMRQMMGNIGQQAGMLSKIPGMKQAAMARRLNDMVKTGGLEANPMMAGLADQLLEAAVAEGPAGLFGARGAAAAGRRKPVSKAKRKDKRKQQKQARRKSRK
ncbi:MAG: signal recognition particle protein [Sandaracinaceae bacterium]|nr:signal recognition particle protein [Sandaracinaceae bacterium]